ncbi:hypothetical protein PUN28_000673 [Cardiocondyla obscurior]|uniref:Secreted protein n=1 Tax=Cardiocondyla obscurior TaxID=286306 RepID=A0AAW2H0G1_9HYME
MLLRAFLVSSTRSSKAFVVSEDLQWILTHRFSVGNELLQRDEKTQPIGRNPRDDCVMKHFVGTSMTSSQNMETCRK